MARIIFLIIIFFLFLYYPVYSKTNPTLDIVWQAETYTPYFYKGKALATPLSDIKIAAIPLSNSGSMIKKDNLFFRWFLDTNLFNEGWGKDFIAFKTGIFPNEFYEIKVEAKSADGTIKIEKTALISNTKPEIVFYERDNIYNIKSEKAVNNFFALSGENKQFISEPYFIPKVELEKINYNWSLNNSAAEKKEPHNILNFSTPPGAKGEAVVDLKINYNDILENIENSFKIIIN